MAESRSKAAFSATRTGASRLDILVNLAGIDHGTFEILQGSLKPDGKMISAVGPAQRCDFNLGWGQSSAP
jgi:hypothetical protein